MDKIFKSFPETGECEVFIDEVVKTWDNNWLISQRGEEYTLCHFNINADNFTGTDVKAKISKQQAKELIVELDLMPEQSPVFRSGKTWRKGTD